MREEIIRPVDEVVGMCRACKEMTSLKESCCGAPIWHEGGWLCPEEDEEEEEEKK